MVTLRTGPLGPALAWAERLLGAQVVEVDELAGGLTSTMLRLALADAGPAVLRLMTREPWRTHGAELTRREAQVQQMLAGIPPAGHRVPAPRSLGRDADGQAAGHPAHLMSCLPGVPTPSRLDREALAEVAGTLAAVHAVRPTVPPRTFQSWAWPAKRVVPPWAKRPDVWRTAFGVLDAEPPDYEPTFLHRDYGPRNLLWSDTRVSGVVDWVETSTGPAWLDVAHCSTTLAMTHGPSAAEGFAAAYVAATARRPEPYWDVVDVVGFLPAPGREPLFARPHEQSALEQRLLAAVGSLG